MKGRGSVTKVRRKNKVAPNLGPGCYFLCAEVQQAPLGLGAVPDSWVGMAWGVGSM